MANDNQNRENQHQHEHSENSADYDDPYEIQRHDISNGLMGTCLSIQQARRTFSWIGFMKKVKERKKREEEIEKKKTFTDKMRELLEGLERINKPRPIKSGGGIRRSLDNDSLNGTTRNTSFS